MKIKMQSEDGYKMYRHGQFEFFATRQGRDGYSLEVYEYVPVADKYMANRYTSRRVQITYEPPCNIERIKERINSFLN
jgi:hypothetical protein